MSRWSAHFRRAASLLLGVHLLQVILLAASAVCDRSLRDDGSASALLPAPVASPGHHAHHVAAVEGNVDATEPAAPDGSSHHSSHTTNCPMAMACAATAIVVPVQTLAGTEVRVLDGRIGHDALALRSLRVAPETPPPRG